MAVDPTYPPLDTPKPVADGVWIVDSGPMKAGGLVPIPVRMAVFRTEAGELVLYSPTRWTPQLSAELERLGRIAWLLAPSSVHWTFVKGWQERHPNAAVLGAPGLEKRGQVKRSGLRIDGTLDESLPLEWDGLFEAVTVPGGLGFREVGLLHRPSRTLALCDLVHNFEPEKLPALQRPAVRLAGGMAPDGQAMLQLRALISLNRAAAKAGAERLVALAPERVVFAHGRWFEADGAARLRRSLSWLLD
jgi:hypothetical protein